MTALSEPQTVSNSRSGLLWALIVTFAVASAAMFQLVEYLVAGTDFSCVWAGSKVALQAPAHLYDFAYVTQMQGWPLGPHKIRPYIYSPAALFVFIPFSLAPYWVGYGLWNGLTAALQLWAGLKARAPWWLMLLPPVAFVIYCGQVTLLIGGLVLGGLALQRTRPLAAGVLFGLAAVVKPQMVLLVPIALAAEGRWRTLAAAGAIAASLAAASAMIWGLGAWVEWLHALPRFKELIFGDRSLVEDAITPFAVLQNLGIKGAWALLLAPAVAVAVWITFRRTQDIADRSIAVFAGALLVSPYAMNYEAALLAPAVAMYLARTGDRRWLGYAVASVVYAVGMSAGVTSVLAALALPVLRTWPSPSPSPQPRNA